MRRLWVYKCNINDDYNQGDWEEFFDQRGGKGEWGGTSCIRNPSSVRLIREELKKHDLVLAWQTNRHAAIGLCRVVALKPRGDEIALVLASVSRFAKPIKLLKFKSSNPAPRRGSAFVQGRQGTLFETTHDEAQEILRLCGCADIGQSVHRKTAPPGKRGRHARSRLAN